MFVYCLSVHKTPLWKHPCFLALACAGRKEDSLVIHVCSSLDNYIPYFGKFSIGKIFIFGTFYLVCENEICLHEICLCGNFIPTKTSTRDIAYEAVQLLSDDLGRKPIQIARDPLGIQVQYHSRKL